MNSLHLEYAELCIYDLYIREPFVGLYVDVFVFRVSKGITCKLTLISPLYLNL